MRNLLILTTLATSAFFLAQAATTLLAARLVPRPPAIAVAPPSASPTTRIAPTVRTERLFGRTDLQSAADRGATAKRGRCPGELRLVATLTAEDGAALALVERAQQTTLHRQGEASDLGTVHIEPHRVHFLREGDEECMAVMTWSGPAGGTMLSTALFHGMFADRP